MVRLSNQVPDNLAGTATDPIFCLWITRPARSRYRKGYKTEKEREGKGRRDGNRCLLVDIKKKHNGDKSVAAECS